MLFRRLKAAGFSQDFVRQAVLPDWWEDSLSSNASTMAMVEIMVGRMLGFSIRDLRSEDRPLVAAPTAEFRLKRDRRTHPLDLRPTLAVAQRMAESIVSSLRTLPTFGGLRDADVVRREVLSRASRVDLGALVEFAWSAGIPVVHMKRFPAAKKPTGIAMFVKETPVVVLCSSYDSPSWLLFHLAHELGHIFSGHVTPATGPLADVDLSAFGEEPDERNADDFAYRLLSGRSRPAIEGPVLGLTGPKLAARVRASAVTNQSDPGFEALAYGFGTHRMPVAQAALRALALNSGGQAVIDAALRARVQEDLRETPRQFVSLAFAA